MGSRYLILGYSDNGWIVVEKVFSIRRDVIWRRGKVFRHIRHSQGNPVLIGERGELDRTTSLNHGQEDFIQAM